MFEKFRQFLDEGKSMLEDAFVIPDDEDFVAVPPDVTEEQLLKSWKEFFNNGTNWKDLDKNITYEKYKAISDKDHVKKIMQMPVHFLQESGKGFFVKKDGYALALREELGSVIDDPAFVEQVRDVIEYRTMDYYQRRYRMKSEG